MRIIFLQLHVEICCIASGEARITTRVASCGNMLHKVAELLHVNFAQHVAAICNAFVISTTTLFTLLCNIAARHCSCKKLLSVLLDLYAYVC